MNIVYLQDVSS